MTTKVDLFRTRGPRTDYWDVVWNDWCIGYVVRDTSGKLRAFITGNPYGQFQPFEKSEFASPEEARDVIVAEFKKRATGRTS